MSPRRSASQIGPEPSPTQPPRSRGGLLRLIGVPQRVRLGRVRVVDGVRYKERRSRGALGMGGTDGREYDVRFPDADRRGRPMRIRCTATRIFDDLTPDPRAELVRSLEGVVRPGDRVLLLGCGTGAAARHLAYLVGPSGGVVALDRDGESIRFARQRYAADQLGFELGWIDTLSGELDDAFDAAVAVDPLRDTTTQREHDKALSEIIRVIRPEGHLFCIGSSDESGERSRRTLEDQAVDPVAQPLRSLGWRASLWRRPR